MLLKIFSLQTSWSEEEIIFPGDREVEAGRHIAALYRLHVKVLGSQFRLKVANARLTPEKKR